MYIYPRACLPEGCAVSWTAAARALAERCRRCQDGIYLCLRERVRREWHRAVPHGGGARLCAHVQRLGRGVFPAAWSATRPCDLRCREPHVVTRVRQRYPGAVVQRDWHCSVGNEVIRSPQFSVAGTLPPCAHACMDVVLGSKYWQINDAAHVSDVRDHDLIVATRGEGGEGARHV